MAESKHSSCLDPETISAFLEGDLERDDAATAAAHLEVCSGCRAVQDEMEALKEGLPSLSKVEVPAHLWGEIERQHRAEVRVPVIERFRRWWAVPALAFAGSAAALTLWVWRPTPPDMNAPAEVAETTERSGLEVALQSVRQAEQTYIEAIVALERAADQDVARYDPEVRNKVERGLVEIDRTIRECRRALQQRPDDFGAHEIMLAAYQQKVEFLTELVAHAPAGG